MVVTGVRIGETRAAVWSEVDFDAGTVRITSGPGEERGSAPQGHQESGGGEDRRRPSSTRLPCRLAWSRTNWGTPGLR